MLVSDEVLYNLKNEAGVDRYNRGVTIAREKNRVFIYKVEYHDKNNFTLNSRVNGHSGNLYNVKIRIENFKIIEKSCECEDFNSHDNICKHICATVINFNNNQDYIRRILLNNVNEKTEQLKKEETNKLLEKKYSTSIELLNSFNESYNTEENIQSNTKTDNIVNGSVKIIPTLHYQKFGQKMTIDFQIGIKQMYKLKNLLDFLYSIEHKANFKYGAKLEFIHTIEKFDKASQKLIPFILKYARFIKYANENANNYYYSSYKTISISSISLDFNEFDELFEIFKNERMNIEITYLPVEYVFIDQEPKVEFDIKKINNDEYKLINSMKKMYEAFSSDNYTYIFIDDKLYRCSKKFSYTTLKLLDLFKRNSQNDIIFNKESLPTFFSLVVPKIRKNINLEKIKETEIGNYIPQDLNVKIYLDYDIFENLIANIKFVYDEKEFNPYSDEKVNVVRNVVQEKQVKNRFINAGFILDEKNNRLVLKDDDKIYEFLSNEINNYMKDYQVLASDSFKSKQIRQPKLGNLGVRVENNLLNIDLSGLDFDKNELADILKKYNIKKKYHRLKDGSFLNLEQNQDIDFINDLTEGMDIDYKKLNNGKIRVPVFRSVYLEKLLDNVKNIEITKNDEYKNIINKTLDKEYDENIKISEKFDKILRPYQKTGYKWLKILDEFRFGGILADDMGLGKTLQLIAIIAAYIKDNNKRKTSFVVCPSSLVLNWKNEVKKFANEITVMTIDGKAEERREKIKSLNKYDLIVTSYDLLKRDIEEYEKINYTFKYIIADEAQYIKNSNTQNATALKIINAEARFALTGTPIENSLSELWSIFDYIMPGYLFNYHKFKTEYETPIVKDEDETRLKRLKNLIEPFILRRVKKDVLFELPDKTITVLDNEMTSEQNKIYLSYLAQAKREIESEISKNGFEKSQIKILALITRLRQICCHPSLFLDNYKGESSKLNQCIELIKDAIESEHKILIFSQFTSMFEIIEKELKKEHIEYYKLIGSTKVSERVELVDKFNKNNDVKVFLISLKAGGTGLNLTGADMVIHYDPWWNLSAENQATDRAYRIGQKNNVQVYKLITQNSIEEKINELQTKKARLAEDMLNTEQTFINKLSREDIMSLFD